MRQSTRVFILIALMVGILFVHRLGFDQYLTLDNLKRIDNDLLIFVQERYWLAIGVFATLLMTAVLTALPITVLLTVIAGFAFGVWVGTALVVICVTSASLIIFLSVRYLLGEWVQKRYASVLVGLNKELKHRGGMYLLVVQLLPMTPTPLINLLSGLTPMSGVTFVWTTALGILPGTVIYTWAGQELHNVHALTDILTLPFFMMLVGLALLIALPLAWWRWMQSS